MNEIVVPKSRPVALALEIVPGLFGLFGVGWLYAGYGTTGALLIIASLFVYAVSCLVLSISAGIGLFCVIPLHLIVTGVSAWRLHMRMAYEANGFI